MEEGYHNQEEGPGHKWYILLGDNLPELLVHSVLDIHGLTLPAT